MTKRHRCRPQQRMRHGWLLLLLLLSLLPTIRSSSLPIAGYTPFTIVTDHNAIDLDLRVLQRELFRYTDEGFRKAKEIYELGGHVAPFAVLQPTTFLPIPEGAQVIGPTQGGDVNAHVLGTTFGNQTTTIHVLYAILGDDPTDYVSCLVGGLAIVDANTTKGCFRFHGTLMVDGVGNLDYTYDVNQDNHNAVTLAGFSRNLVQSPFLEYPALSLYHAYYGRADYADAWVQSAFASGTVLLDGTTLFDFSTLEPSGRAEAVRVGILVMNLWMEVHRRMERAFESCDQGSMLESRRHWDQTVAYYTGSLEGTGDDVNGAGGDEGLLLHWLADDLCVWFSTCENGRSAGVSRVNQQVFFHFERGHAILNQTDNVACFDLLLSRIAVEEWMVVPLVQATLLQLDFRVTSDNPIVFAACASFAAALLPLVHHCNATDAAILRDHAMGTSPLATRDFVEAKQALERNYACLHINCAMVGGLFDPTSDNFVEGTAMCLDESTTNNNNNNTDTTPRHDNNQARVIGGSFGGAAGFALVVGILLCWFVRRDREEVSPPQLQPSPQELT